MDIRVQFHFVRPSPELTPEDVVKFLLDALQNNDLTPHNDGIRAAFEFASPSNRVFTGPVARFIEMVKSPVYADMIGYERANVGQCIVRGGYAQQMVRLFRQDGRYTTFMFALTQQTESPHEDCWMVDSVVRLDS